MSQNRQTSIDYMKSALVIGMILAHSLQLFSKPRGLFWAFSTVINLITFSGFLFCFGYVFYTAYFTRHFKTVSGRMAKTAVKTLLGYYISGVVSLFLITPIIKGKPYLLADTWRFLLLFDLAPYSEFLLAFFVLTLLSLLCFGAFRYMAATPWAMLLVSLVCLSVSVLMPANFVETSPLALFIGTQTQAAFPIVQYLPFFLVGIYFARHKLLVSWAAGVVGLLGTVVFIGYFLSTTDLPPRFPPSIYSLMGSTGILYAYFLAAKWIERRAIVIPSLLSIGQNSLFYLIVSNLILFSLSRVLQTTPPVALSIGGLVILVISFLADLIVKPPAPVEKKIPQPV